MSSTLNQPGGGESGHQTPDSTVARSSTFSVQPRPKRRGRLTLLLLLVLIPLSVYGWNYLTLQRKVSEVLDKDPRNKGVEVSAHYKTYVNPSVLVYDLRGVAGTNSRLDVTRVLLQFAEQVKDKKFERVELAFRGETKFLLDGDYFQQLGREYNYQNPVYTTNHMPENLRLPDGTRAYDTWTGGLLGVSLKQMQDFNDFHDRWYWRSLTK
jgi:hypothetical protein